MVFHHFSGEWIPDVLITGNQSDRRSDGEIVEDLGTFLVLHCPLASCELREIVLQWPAYPVVIESRSETVILPAVEETAGKKRDARIAGDRICLLRRIPGPPEYANSAQWLSAPPFWSGHRGALPYKKILREIPDRGQVIGFEFDGQPLRGRPPKKAPHGWRNLSRR